MTNDQFTDLYAHTLLSDRIPTPFLYQETALACYAFLRKGVSKSSRRFTTLDGVRLSARNTRPECFTPWEE